MKQRIFLIMAVMLLMVASAHATVTSVTLNSPANNAWVTTLTPSFNFTAVSDINTTFSCELLIDSVGYGTNASTANDTATVITANASLAQGARVWEVSCTDVNGTVSSAQRTVNVDATDPSPSISSPSDGATLSDTTPQVTFTITDNIDTSIAYVIYLDGLTNSSGSASNGTATSINLSTLSDGTYSLIVQGTDDAGNAANSSTVTFTIDTTVETTTESSSSGGRSRIPIVAGDADEIILRPGGGRYAFLLDRQVHYVRAISIVNDAVTLVFTSEPVEVVLHTGERRNVDITGDNIVDISVEIMQLAAKAAYVAIGLPRDESVPQTVPETTPEANVPEAPEPPAETLAELPPAPQPEASTAETPDSVSTEVEPARFGAWMWILLVLIALAGIGWWKTKQ